MSKVYCDTSVLVPLFVVEATSPAIEKWFRGRREPVVVSDMVLLEFSSVISRCVRQSRLADKEAQSILRSFDDWHRRHAICVDVGRSDFVAARQIVERFSLALRGPDALHLALVVRERSTLVTLDSGLTRACAALTISVVDVL